MKTRWNSGKLSSTWGKLSSTWGKLDKTFEKYIELSFFKQ